MALAREDIEAVAPLSPLQEGMLFHSTAAPESGIYVNQLACELLGDLDAAALREAWRRTVARHSILRTLFAPGADRPLQIVVKEVELPWSEDDLRDDPANASDARLEALLAADRRRGFDPARPPLLRLRLVRTGTRRHVLIWTHHHAILDGWSLPKVLAEVLTFYDACRRGTALAEVQLPPPVPFRDHVRWLSRRGHGEARAFWREFLAVAPESRQTHTVAPQARETSTVAPEARETSTIASPEDRRGERRGLVPAALATRLISRARRERVTLSVLLEAAWAILLSRLGDSDDVLYGTVDAGRDDGPTGVEEIVGPLLQTVPMRVRFDQATGVGDWLRALHARRAAAVRHAHPGLVAIRRFCGLNGSRPLFESLVVFENYPLDAPAAAPGALAVRPLAVSDPTSFPLTLIAAPGDGLRLRLQYDPSRYHAVFVERLLGIYRTLLGSLAEGGPRLAELAWLPTAERHRVVVEWGAASAATLPAAETLHDLVGEHAATATDAVALVDGDTALSYGALWRRSGALANALRHRGIGAESRVAICLERELDLPLAVLAALRVGGAALVLDSRLPPERLRYIAGDAGAAVLVTTPTLRRRLDLPLLPALAPDTTAPPAELPAVDPDQIAVLIYTSGSTGQPKAVAMPHGPLARLMRWQAADSGKTPKTMQFAALSFDVAYQEMFSTWAAGGTLVMVDEETRRDPRRLLERVLDVGIKRLFLPVVACRHWLAEVAETATPPRTVGRLITAGEQLRLGDAERHALARLGDLRLDNQYGPAETHVVTVLGLAGDAGGWPDLPPIGSPLPHVRTLILDRRLRPRPAGTPGELALGGAALARGYLGRPRRTASCFVPDPFVSVAGGLPGARLYLSGDLARHRPDGILEFLRRRDQQIKIRGVRVEPGEVEARLLTLPGVSAAAVAAVATDGEPRLAAWVVRDQVEPVTEETLRRQLATFLPAAMVPTSWSFLERLPLGATGKIDYRALPDPATPAAATATSRMPLEGIVGAIIAGVLDRESDLGPDDDFFALGGHSLTAARAASRIRDACGVELPVSAFFEAPTVRALAAAIEARRGIPLPPPLTVSVTAEAPTPLSFAQERLWFLDHLENTATYNMPAALRLRGSLDVAILGEALNAIVSRHDILRTRFFEDDGKAWQIARPAAEAKLALNVESVTAEELAEVRANEALRPFDLAGGAPPFRARLLRLTPRDHVLLLTFHHIAADGWSLGILVGELAELYTAASEDHPPRLPKLTLRYADYAVWQRTHASLWQDQLDHWRRRLDGLPPVLDLPLDRPRPRRQTFRGASVQRRLDSGSTTALGRLGRARGASLFAVLHAALAALLYRLTGAGDLAIGTPIAERRDRRLEGIIGLFLNTVVLRSRITGKERLLDLADASRRAILEAQDHGGVPFERVVDALRPERSLAHAPLFQVILALQPAAAGELALSRLDAEPLDPRSRVARVDLTFLVTESTAGLRLYLEYATDLFDRTTAERFLELFETLLRAFARGGEQRLDLLPILNAEDWRRQIVEWNATAHPLPESTITECLAARAKMTPGAVAVVDAADGAELSYDQLRQRGAALAAVLRAAGVAPEVPVGLALPRRPGRLVALLGILEAGGAYVPLAGGDPEQRRRFLIEDAAVRVIVADQRRPWMAGLAVVEVEPATGHVGQPLPCATTSSPGPDNLAYVMYTSGSTGRPKGTLVTHRNVVRLALGLRAVPVDLGPGRTLLHAAPLAFDASTFEIWGALLNGARLVLHGEDVPTPDGLRAAIDRHGVDTMWLTAALFAALIDADPKCLGGVDQLLVGGDVVSPEHVRRLRRAAPGIHVVNGYGPTEGTTFTSCGVAPGDLGEQPLTLPIGRPIGNTRVYVVDRFFQPVPVGVAGELYVGGSGLARAYLGRPGRTAERFVPDRFATAGSDPGGERLYRTGDWVKWSLGGELVFLGRRDHQVKIRGFRVELGEIEARLTALPGIRQAVVAAPPSASGRKLAAYVVADDGARDDRQAAGDAWREALARQLPEVMLPAAFVVLARLPRTPQGKLDRAALPDPFAEDKAPALAFEATPRTDAELVLAEVWADVLGVSSIGVDDSFFALGGDSILSIQAVARAKQRGLSVSTQQIFEHQTLGRLAAAARPLDAAAMAPIRDDHGPSPLTPAQHWFFAQRLPRPEHWNQPMLLDLGTGVEPRELAGAAAVLTARHGALRSRFERAADGGWRQIVDDVRHRASDALNFIIVDLTALSPAQQEHAVAQQGGRLQGTLDLERGPLSRLALFRGGAARGDRLLWVVHHLVIDGVSWRILIDELATVYQQLRRGEEIFLPAPTSPYGRWAEHLNEWAEGDLPGGEAELWRRAAVATVGEPTLPADRPGGSDTVAGARRVDIELDPRSTSALLRDVHAAYHTEIDDILLSALARAVHRFTGAGRILLNLESHGREALFPALDLERTVGWFTAIYPVVLEVATEASEIETPAATLHRVKEDLRAVPNGGVGYGVARYLRRESADGRSSSTPEPEIAFNYLGQFRAPSGTTSWRIAPEHAGKAQHPAQPRPHRLEINGLVLEDRLRLAFTYSGERYDPATIERLAKLFRAELDELIVHCTSPGAFGLTPSDIPEIVLDRQARGLDELTQPSLNALTRRLLGQAPGATAKTESFEAVYPLSPLQEGMLYHSLAAPGSGIYVVQIAWELDGEIDAEAFRAAWRRTVARHAVFRTRFDGLEGRQPLQIVEHPDPDGERHLPWRLEDWRTLSGQAQVQRLDALLAAERQRGFDPARAPLQRFFLLRTGETRHRFLWSHHHALLDGWSLSQVLGDVFGFYQEERGGASHRTPTPRPFRDYVRWLLERDRSAAEAYWRGTLAGFEAATPLPIVHGRGDARSRRPSDRRCRLPTTLTARVEDLARSQRLTANLIAQLAWAVLLARTSGERDVVFGTTVAGRPAELDQVETMVGPFINTVPVRARPEPAVQVLDALRRLAEEQSAREPWSDQALVEIHRWSDVAASAPLFETLFVFDNYPVDRRRRETGVRALSVDAVEQTNYALTLVVAPGERFGVQLKYDPTRCAAGDVERWLGHYRTLLADLVERPRARLGELEILAPAQRHQIIAEWNDTAAELPRHTCLHGMFAARAAAAPDRVALISGNQTLSYGELERRARRAAEILRRRLTELGVGGVPLVAIDLVKGWRQALATLAVHFAGAAYLPIDPAWPQRRRWQILEQADARLAVTAHHEAVWPPAVSPCLWRELERETCGATMPPPTAEPDDLAYVIFTSGSTGVPKGVAIRHAMAANTVLDINQRFSIGSDDRVLALSALTFDLSVYDLFGLWAAGGTVVLPIGEEVGDPARWAAMVQRHRVTLWDTVPALVQLLSEVVERQPGTASPNLRQVLMSGDWIPVSLPDRLRACYPNARVHSLGGATEGSIWSIGHPIGDVDPTLPSIPYGRPLANQRFYVLDSERQPCPIGVTGDLYIGGEGVAMGYWRDTERTAASFGETPWGDGGRLYRTGDLGRYLRDGEIEFLGRDDFQVKVNGYRVELGEIETVLRARPDIVEAIVVVREDVPGEKRLVGWVTAEPSAALEGETLRRAIGEALPAYMVPAVIAVVSELPLTANGKVDRQALIHGPLPTTGDGAAAAAPEMPTGPAEELLATLFADVLAAPRIGRRDSFFDLGGHSLRAAQLVARIREAFRRELPIRALFESPTVAEIAELLDTAATAELPPIEPSERGTDGAPLSFAQQRLWFLERLEGPSATYNIPAAIGIEGRLDVTALRRALAEIVRRHHSLRTLFVEPAGAGDDNNPVQRLCQTELEVPIEDIDPAQVPARAARHATRPFDLSGDHLVRATLLRRGPASWVLLVNLHHIAADAWSVSVFLRELAVLYRAFADTTSDRSPLAEPAIQYADFARWQRGWLQGDVLERQLTFWRRSLAGLPPLLELPLDRPRPNVQSFRGAAEDIHLDAGTADALRALGRHRGATLFMILLAAFQALLGRLSGQRDVVVGTPVANRSRRELEELIGFFANTLALPGAVTGKRGFGELLDATRKIVLEAFAHQDVPFERVVEELDPPRSLGHAPIFQTMLVLQNVPMSAIELPDLMLTPLPPQSHVAKFDLVLTLAEVEDGGLGGTLEFSTDLFDRTTVRRWLASYRRLLATAAAAPERPLERLDLLAETERAVILASAAPPMATAGPHLAHRLVSATARRRPEAAAVRADGRTLSYGELERRAGRLAARLRAQGAGFESRVGLAVERGPELAVAVLAVWHAGGTCVPLDPDYPDRRLVHMLDAAKLDALLLSGRGRRVCELGPRLAAVPTIVVDATTEPSAVEPVVGAAFEDATGSQIAYLIFTSGSTGAPKAIALPHRVLFHLACWDAAERDAALDVLQFASPSFDVAFMEMLAAWTSGGCLVLPADDERPDAARLAELIARQRVAEAILPVVMLEALAEVWRERPELGRGLRRLISTGEQLRMTPALTGALARFGSCQLLNDYGPAETHVVTWARYRGDQARWARHVPIGKPLPGCQTRLLRRLEPVLLGAVGELCLGGAVLARGYFRRPSRTAERFIPDPSSTAAGARLYLTGDLARQWPDGSLDLLGRADRQIKLRGFRVEPAEVERRLLAHPAVAGAAVATRGEGINKSLVAWVVPANAGSGDAPDIEDLRQALLSELPEPMVPASWMIIDRLPLTPNRKIDFDALPAPEPPPDNARQTPRDAAEEAIAEIWRDVLGMDLGTYEVGVDQSFFHLGGHSLLATRVTNRINRIFATDLPLRAIFESPTIAGLARTLRAMAVEQPSGGPALASIPRRAAGTPAPLSFSQERLWFLHQLEGPSPTYNMPAGLRLAGDLDVEALRAALDVLATRHDVLRTRFVDRGDGPRQEIDASARPRLEVVEIDGTELAREIDAHAGLSFDLGQAPLVRLRLLRLAPEDHVLLINLHHIIADGWSVAIFVRELTAAWCGRRLPPLPIQFGDWAAWQHRRLEAGKLDAQLEGWRRELDGLPPLLELPTDRPRPAVQSFRGAAAGFRIEPALAGRLRELCREHDVTLFQLTLTAFQLLLGRYAGRRDVAVGTPMANRGREEIEGLIGFFINMVVRRTRIDPKQHFDQLLAGVRRAALDADGRQDAPFERVVQAVAPPRSTRFTPLFQVTFSLENAPETRLELPGLTVTPLEVPCRVAKFDLGVTLIDGGSDTDGLAGVAEYATDLFDESTIVTLLGAYRTLLTGIAGDPRRRAGDLRLSDHLPQRRVATPPQGLIHEIVAQRARRDPTATALISEGGEVSYGELRQRVRRLASWLRRRGVVAETRVALHLRDEPWAVAVLAVLEAGGAFVPLDPGQPPARLRRLIDDARPALILTSTAGFEAVVPVIDLGGLETELAAAPGSEPTAKAPRPALDQLAYVLFTSGSTGRPKGVAVSHRGLANLVEPSSNRFTVGARDRVLQFFTPSFDASVWEIFTPLARGAALVFAPRRERFSGPALAELIRQRRITTILLLPSVLDLLSGEELPSLRTVAAGGEAMTAEVVDAWAGRVRLVNVYGPTEATVYVTQEVCVPGQPPTLGEALPHTSTDVLDDALRPLPRGAVGELCLGGVGLARGYLDLPEGTAERFVPDPFAARPGARLYRSGDLARLDARHRTEFLGRTDHQVKWRGFRIELGEIEAALVTLDSVHRAAVELDRSGDGPERLIAYVAADIETAALRGGLAELLPEYMVPSEVVVLPELPAMASGKVDRRALADHRPTTRRPSEGPPEPPANALEREIADVWRRVLGVEEIGRDDNFFELGGHSLSLAGVHKALAERHTLRVIELFQHPTVRTLAGHLDGTVAPEPDTRREDAKRRRQQFATARRKMRRQRPR